MDLDFNLIERSSKMSSLNTSNYNLEKSLFNFLPSILL